MLALNRRYQILSVAEGEKVLKLQKIRKISGLQRYYEDALN